MILRWWPPAGFAAMVLLGWAVGTGPVAIDDWFERLGREMGSYGRVLLVFSQPLVLAVALLIGVVVAVRQGRKRLALAMVVSPLLAIAVVRICKPIFGRMKGDGLAYPSGHTTFLVVVTGLLVLLAGMGVWSVVAALSVCLLGMLGVAVSFHYFTDTVGAALLGTAVVCLVATIVAREPSR